MNFISKDAIPCNKKLTYCSFVCHIKPHKKETHRVQLVVGGDKLECDFDTGAPAAFMTDTKILCSSVISDAHKGAKFLDVDIKYFFLMSLPEPEYMQIAYKYSPDKICQRYNLDEKLLQMDISTLKSNVECMG